MLELEAVTWTEVRDFLAAHPAPVALLPTGATEAHGPHLPLATDVIIARGTARRAAAALEARGHAVVIAPALAFGVTEYAGPFAGTVGVDAATAQALVEGVCAGLARTGLARVCLVNAHLEPANVAVLRAAATAAGAALADPTERRFARTLTEEFRRGACHAGRYETSLVLAEAPGLVRGRAHLEPLQVDLVEKMRAGARTFVEAGAPAAYFGDPAAATAEEGEAIYRLLVEMVVTVVEERWPAS